MKRTKDQPTESFLAFPQTFPWASTTSHVLDYNNSYHIWDKLGRQHCIFLPFGCLIEGRNVEHPVRRAEAMYLRFLQSHVQMAFVKIILDVVNINLKLLLSYTVKSVKFTRRLFSHLPDTSAYLWWQGTKDAPLSDRSPTSIGTGVGRHGLRDYTSVVGLAGRWIGRGNL